MQPDSRRNTICPEHAAEEWAASTEPELTSADKKGFEGGYEGEGVMD
jgi:hypothetical protein